MVIIYKITSPSGRIYIGQSSNFKRRKIEYKRNKCKAQTLLYNSFLKYGYNAHTFEIIDEVDKSLADEKEIYYIQHFNTYNTKYGLNLTPGGKRPAPKKGRQHYKAKIVYQWSYNGEFVKKWECIKDVEEQFGWSSTTIGMSVKSKTSCYGYIWTFDNISPGIYRSQRVNKEIPSVQHS